MASGLAEQYRRWFEYEKDAHAKVVRSLESVPDGWRSGPEYRKAVDLLAHIVAARRTWLGRFGVAPPASGTLFPANADLADVVAELRAVEGLWADYLGRATDEELGQEFEYQSYDGGRFRNQIADILTQLFAHSSYHRGQIAVLVRAAGGEPAITDFVYWCRVPVPSSR
jgi:uncharacterized damage-inducible protein DinB